MAWEEFKPKIAQHAFKTITPWMAPNSGWPRWMKKIERFIRVHLFVQPRYLIDVWTIEEAQDVHSMHGIDLERQLTKAFIREAEKRINDRSLRNR